MVGTGEVSSNLDEFGIPIVIGYAGLKPVYIDDDLKNLLKILLDSKNVEDKP